VRELYQANFKINFLFTLVSRIHIK